MQVSHNKGAGIIVREGGRGSFTAVEVRYHRPATRMALYMAALRAESTTLQHSTTCCNARPAAGWHRSAQASANAVGANSAAHRPPKQEEPSRPRANMQLAHNGRSGFEISGKETPPGAKKIETLPVLQGNKVKPTPARRKMQRTTQHELAT